MEHEAYIDMAAAEEAHWWFQGRRKILASVIARLNLPDRPRILELGAGTGGNFEMLSRFGKVTAIEMNEMARALAQRKACTATGQSVVAVLPGYLPDGLPELAHKFDLVCLFDVLEHVEDDARALWVVRDLLAPGGVAIVTVPAFAKLWGPHDERVHHKRRYERAELAEKLRRAGFSVSKLSYTNMCLFPGALAVRLGDRLQRLFARNSVARWAGILPGPVNRCFSVIFGAERFLIQRMNLPIGLSLLAVAQAAPSCHVGPKQLLL